MRPGCANPYLSHYTRSRYCRVFNNKLHANFVDEQCQCWRGVIGIPLQPLKPCAGRYRSTVDLEGHFTTETLQPEEFSLRVQTYPQDSDIFHGLQFLQVVSTLANLAW